MELLKKLKTRGISVLQNLDDETLSKMILIANKSYYNEDEIITDSQYDILKEFIEKNLEKFEKFFSCKNPNDIVSEFFFLVGNLHASQNNYDQSNFYLNIAHFFNPKFIFNLSLSAENYYLNEDYIKTKSILKHFNKKDNFYYWFRRHCFFIIFRDR